MSQLIDGIATDAFPYNDRGLQYGDGVWETVAVREGQLMQWAAHWQRLQYGMRALHLASIDESLLLDDINQLLQSQKTGVLKIIVTRGSGGRGYSPVGADKVRRIVALYAMPEFPESYSTQGVDVYHCKTRLAYQPLLAGFKHLNRLEQVLARSEFCADYQEGIVQDYQDNIIEGTMSNLILWTGNKEVVTPCLEGCGIKGIARQVVMDVLHAHNYHVIEATVSLERVMQAKGLVLCNSVIGVWPVRSFNGQVFSVLPEIKWLQQHINEAGLL